jgi:hypothetical protein
MKFRYIIIGWDWCDGPFGTNDLKEAMEYASWEMYTVVDVETGTDLSLEGHPEIKKASDPFRQEEEEEEEGADPDDEATPGRTVHSSLIPDPYEDTPFDER